MKCVGKSSSSREANGLEAMDMLKNEAALLCDLEHPCIVKVLIVVCTCPVTLINLFILLHAGCGSGLSAKVLPPSS